MRKNLILSAMAFAALAFAGCSQDDTFNESPAVNNAIEFGTYVGRDAASRASVATTDTVKRDGFGVFAFYTAEKDFYNSDCYTSGSNNNKIAPNFMDNEKVFLLGTGDWDYRPGKYWPNDEDDKLSFFAYAPYDVAQGYYYGSPKKGNTYISFTVDGNIKNQKDLIYSKKVNETHRKNADGTVLFTFKHALSRIGFDVTYSNAFKDTKIYIKKIILSGEQHSFIEDADTKKKTVVYPNAGIFYQKGNLDIIGSSDADVVFEDWKAPDNKPGRQVLTWDVSTDDNYKDKYFQRDANTNNGRHQNVLDGEYFMIIPQNFTDETWGTRDPFYVFVEFVVEAPLGIDDDNTGTPIAADPVKKTYYLSSNAVKIKFEPGKAYKLVLNIDDKLDYVDCQAYSVKYWDTEHADYKHNVN